VTTYPVDPSPRPSGVGSQFPYVATQLGALKKQPSLAALLAPNVWVEAVMLGDGAERLLGTADIPRRLIRRSPHERDC
jgi:hypothetical protein